MNERAETTLADYLTVLRQRRLFVLVIAVLCAAAALVASSLQSPSYTATSSIAVRDVNQDLTLIGGAAFNPQTPLQQASAHQALVERTEVVDRVRRLLHTRLTDGQLRDKTEVSIDPNSVAIKITAHDRRARVAADIANAFARADASVTTKTRRRDFAIQANRIKQRLDALPKVTRLHPIDRHATERASLQDQYTRLRSLSSVAVPIQVTNTATPPSSPASPKPVRNTIAAFAFGLLLGIALAYIRATLDRRLRTEQELESAVDKPIVGHIRSQAFGAGLAATGKRRKQHGLTNKDEESFRILRHNVRYLTAGEGLRTIVVTSGMAEEGKSTVSAGLAMTYAAAGTRTLLVECDLRRPVLAERLGLNPGPGLSEYLTGQASPQEILQVVAVPGTAANGSEPAPANSLVCITAGALPPRPSDLLASDRFAEFLENVSEAYEAVVIDSSPLLPVADTLEIVPQASGVLVCVRLQRTTQDQVQSTLAALKRLPARPLGLVLTNVQETGEGYYGYYESSA